MKCTFIDTSLRQHQQQQVNLLFSSFRLYIAKHYKATAKTKSKSRHPLRSCERLHLVREHDMQREMINYRLR